MNDFLQRVYVLYQSDVDVCFSRSTHKELVEWRVVSGKWQVGFNIGLGFCFVSL